LEHFSTRMPSQLSGGQQQRVAVARAVVNRPLVLLLDEPLNALDSKLRKGMQIELKQLQRRLGITFIFVTHDQEEALSMSDRLAVMNEGSIEQISTPREIYEAPQNLFVAGFVGQINILDAEITTDSGTTYGVQVEGLHLQLQRNSHGAGPFQPRQRVKVLVRPEDLRIWRPSERPDPSRVFAARIVEVIYKGTTVDLVLQLPSGKEMAASRFFDEDDDQLEFSRGESVFVDWVPGWEVVLPDEK
jgi:spermidine/putrescine transport system ATP-binding protein